MEVFKLELNRDYYYIHSKVYEWLRKNLGEYYDNPDAVYSISMTFGYTFLEFKHEEDMNKFKEWVEVEVKKPSIYTSDI